MSSTRLARGPQIAAKQHESAEGPPAPAAPLAARQVARRETHAQNLPRVCLRAYMLMPMPPSDCSQAAMLVDQPGPSVQRMGGPPVDAPRIGREHPKLEGGGEAISAVSAALTANRPNTAATARRP